MPSIPFSSKAYNYIVDHFSGWRIGPAKPHDNSSQPKRVGYYLWHFPVLSETFIQREIIAVRRAGLAVNVFADEPEDVGLLDENARLLMQATHYLLPQDSKRLAEYRRQFFFSNPALYLNLLIYTILHRYSGYKNLQEDIRVFHKAVYLAGSVKSENVNHIHSPWASVSAFIALVASRLLRIPYSVQARASGDLYRRTSRHALAEKFENAQFIITNSQLNCSFIKLYLNQRAEVPLHMIYEGVDMAQFTPPATSLKASSPIRILTVARLIEEKGLVYLLQALKLLQATGCSFHCEIVGAPDQPMYASYFVELKELWVKLALGDSVSFPGALPFEKVLRKYQCADIFVLPCVTATNGGRDVTPNVLIEAMAMKLPVISTNMSAIPEIVEDGVSGLLVPPRNARALAKALMKLVAEPELRKTLGENARKRVEERFDINKNIVQYLELFEGKTR